MNSCDSEKGVPLDKPENNVYLEAVIAMMIYPDQANVVEGRDDKKKHKDENGNKPTTGRI